VNIAAQATSGDLDPVVLLYNPVGTLIATSDDQQGLDAVLRLALPENGTYVVQAQAL